MQLYALPLNLKKEAYRELYALRQEEKGNEKIHFTNSKHMNGLCHLFKVQEKRQKGEKRKRKRDICLYLILSAGNIAGTLNLLVSARIKTLLYFRCPLVSKFIHCGVCLSNCLLLYIPFLLHFRLNLFSLNVLFAF